MFATTKERIFRGLGTAFRRTQPRKRTAQEGGDQTEKREWHTPYENEENTVDERAQRLIQVILLCHNPKFPINSGALLQVSVCFDCFVLFVVQFVIQLALIRGSAAHTAPLLHRCYNVGAHVLLKTALHSLISNKYFNYLFPRLYNWFDWSLNLHFPLIYTI